MAWRSCLPGSSITTVMRRPFDQCVCSPINILRSSASDKFSTGFERFTTIPSASSVAGWLCGANPTDSLVPSGSTWDSKMAAPNINKPKVTRGIVAHLLEGEACLEGQCVDRLIAPSCSVVVLQLQSHKLTQVVAQAHRRAMAEADVGKHRLALGGIDVLVAHIRAVRAESFGKLRVEARRIEHARSSLGCMAKDQGLIQPLEVQPHVNGMRSKYGLADSWRILRRQKIPVD